MGARMDLFGLARVIYIGHNDAVKTPSIFLVLALASLSYVARADEPILTVQKQDEGVSDGTKRLVPSQLDPTLCDARDKIFIPWSSPVEASGYWEKMAKENVPIYKEFKEGDLSRDLYIPNPGIAYWVLGGMTESAFWKVQAEKEKIGDALISASLCKAPNGVTNIWALWAPKKRAYLLLLKMIELGITQAKIEDEAATSSLSPDSAKPLLPDGRYLIISADKGNAVVQKCEIINGEDSVFIGFPAPLDHPEYGVKPLRIFIDGEHFQFSIGPSNYEARVLNQLPPGTTTYVGQLFQGKLTGVKTEAGWSTYACNFLLYKD